MHKVLRVLVPLMLTRFASGAPVKVAQGSGLTEPRLASRPLKKLPNVVPATGWVYGADENGKLKTWRNDPDTLTKFFNPQGQVANKYYYCDDPDCPKCYQVVYGD